MTETLLGTRHGMCLGAWGGGGVRGRRCVLHCVVYSGMLPEILPPDLPLSPGTGRIVSRWTSMMDLSLSSATFISHQGVI